MWDPYKTYLSPTSNQKQDYSCGQKFEQKPLVGYLPCVRVTIAM